MLAALIAATLAFTASTPSDPIAPGQVASEKGEETMENVVQENAIRGGLEARFRDEHGRLRRSRSRAVKGIDQDVKLNKALWTLSEKMAELKGLRAAA